MTIKYFLLSSAAALVAASGARAADAIVVAEPEPVEYVRICDAYGAGFFYIPGSETCLKISGHLRYQAKFGDDAYQGTRFKTYKQYSRATLRFDARSQTELGTLRSFIETSFQYGDGSNDPAKLPHAYIELGGFRIGATDDIFGSWTGGAGGVLSDDVINYLSGQTNQVSYTFKGENGFSAIIAAEQGTGTFNVYDNKTGKTLTVVGGKDKKTGSYVIDDYTPYLLAGAKVQQGWGGISAIAAYDPVIEEFAGKLRVDVKFTGTVSGFIMGGYQSGYGSKANIIVAGNYFAQWYGDYAVWSGLTAKVSDKATLNGQVGYESEGTVAAGANVKYELVPGFVITPEVNYTKFDGIRERIVKNNDAFGGILRFQRNF